MELLQIWEKELNLCLYAIFKSILAILTQYALVKNWYVDQIRALEGYIMIGLKYFQQEMVAAKKIFGRAHLFK